MTAIDSSAAAPASILPIRSDLEGDVPYGAPQRDVPVRLNVNESPFGPSEDVLAEIVRTVTTTVRELNRYPDRECVLLRADLADYLDQESGVRVTPDRIWAANGSNEVLSQLLLAFGGPGRTALAFSPTYAMYREYSRNSHTRWVTGHRTADFALDPNHAAEMIRAERPSIILLTSPNNPTGTSLPFSTLQAVLDVARDVVVPDASEGARPVVVVDEAYAEFRRPGARTALELLDAHPNLVVTRTMSKAFGSAGLRVGYLASSSAVVDQLRVVRLPYHLSAVTQAVARSVLAHSHEAAEHVKTLREERERTMSWMRAFAYGEGHGIEVADSDANFLLFGRFDEPHEVWQGLLERGVLIREVGPPGWLRVSIGSQTEMARFRNALSEVLSAHG